MAPAVVLLHGLGGTGAEWARTTAWLRGRGPVVAPDALGHGERQRHPTDISPEAHVADVVRVIEELAEGPVVLVGQSLGGNTAMLVAAAHPERVRALVMVDSGPAGRTEADVAPVQRALARWPDPHFDVDVLMRVLRAAVLHPRWDAWERGRCLALVVRAERGMLSAAEAGEMAARRPGTRVVEIAGAGHDVHLDAPDAFHTALAAFLDALE